MIISKIYNSFDKEQQDALVSGLAFGLAFGLVSGLVSVLAFGLASGLASGLAFGLASGLASVLAFGLAVGLVSGLASVLAFGLAVGLVSGILSPIWLFILAIIAIAEILFFFDKAKPNAGENKYWFTILHKGEAILETSLVVVNLANIAKLLEGIDLLKVIQGWIPAILQGIYYIGIVVVVIAAIACWIWLNSLKYKEEKRKVGRPRKVA
jgi:MFS family permease